MGISREGATVKGSRLVPLLLLAMVVVLLFARGLSTVDIDEFRYGSGLPFLVDALVGVRRLPVEIPIFLAYQIKVISILVVISLIPGIAGSIYRRAFWTWFLASCVLLFLLNQMLAEISRYYVELKLWYLGMENIGGLEDRIPFYLWSETLLIALLLARGLRRHSAASIGAGTRRRNILLVGILVVAAIGWSYGVTQSVWFFNASLWQISGIAMLLLVSYALLKQTLLATDQGRSRKNIVMCLDGTWNQPGTTDYGYLAETNVFKLFGMLKGTPLSKRYNASQCKEFVDDAGTARQTAFYYHGVGNKVENSELGQLFGGAFGIGADAIVERAYLDVVRVYRPGDRIFIFGFSRGAAIARLLAGVIGRRGIPEGLWTLRLFGRHWSVWKSSRKMEDVPVEVLGCWDTVGAFGISKNILGIPFQKMNLLKDLTVALCVKRAYHMVALDETRDSFEPTLMDPDPTAPNRIIEVWFSGNHANVGGGYATDKLSNVTLDFLLKRVSSGYAWAKAMVPGDESWGLYLNAAKKDIDPNDGGKTVTLVEPDPKGQIRHSTGAMYAHAPRKLPIHAVIDDSVFERMREALPVYAPQSLFDLNEELVKKRGDIEVEVKRLVETSSLDEEEYMRILTWSQKNLSLTKWSKYLESNLDQGQKLKDKLKPAVELINPTLDVVGVSG